LWHCNAGITRRIRCADVVGQLDELRTFHTFSTNGGYCNRTNKKAVEKTSLPPTNLSANYLDTSPFDFLVFIIFIIIVYPFCYCFNLPCSIPFCFYY